MKKVPFRSRKNLPDHGRFVRRVKRIKSTKERGARNFLLVIYLESLLKTMTATGFIVEKGIMLINVLIKKGNGQVLDY